MVKINFLVVLLIISSIASIISLFVSIGVYNMDYGAKLSAHYSSEANIGLFVESSPAPGGSTSGGGTSGGGGGGGGGGNAGGKSKMIPNFKVTPDNFNLKIVSGDSQTNEIVVENIGETIIDIIVDVTGIKNYIYFDSNSFRIFPGKRARLKFTIDAPEPGVYAGKILFTHQGITKEALVLVNVISEGVLFDATITIPDLYRILRQGQVLPALIELIEIGQEAGADVTMNYLIKDFEDNIYYTESETFYVEGAKSYNKRFSTIGLKPGDYILGVELVYIGGFATSTAHFRISDSLLTPQTWFAIWALIIALIVAILALLFFRHKKKKFKSEAADY